MRTPQPSPPTAALLAGLDSLAFPQRRAVLAARAREMAGTRELAHAVDELAGSDSYHRDIALFCSIAGGYGRGITAAMADPDHRIRHRAISAWLRSSAADGTADAEVARLLHDAPMVTRQLIYRTIRATGPNGIADSIIDDVRSRFGDREASRLLNACHPATVERLFPQIGYALTSWRSFAHRHPAALLDAAGRELGELNGPQRAAWWRRHGDAVVIAGRQQPLRACDLIDRFGPPGILPGDLRHYRALADAAPDRILALLTTPGRQAWLRLIDLPRPLLTRLARRVPDRLAPLAHGLRDNLASLVRLLKAVPPSQRGDLFDAAHAHLDPSHTRPSDRTMMLLPRPRQTAEARRVLTIAAVRQDETLTLHYTAYLPWADAKVALAAATARSSPDERAAGYELTIACATRSGDPAVLTEALDILVRTCNDQDPVRSRVFAALSAVPPRLLDVSCVPRLERLVSQALDARDRSAMTTTAVARLAANVLRDRFDAPPLLTWALATLDRLLGTAAPSTQIGPLAGLGGLSATLRRGQETQVFNATEHWLRAAAARDDLRPLLALTRALDRRAWRVPALQAMLGDAAIHATVVAGARESITLWLADPTTRAGRAGEVVQADPSAINIPEVWRAACASRTDLLDVALHGPPPRGRFQTGLARWAPYPYHPDRWLPRQRRAYADLAATISADEGAALDSRRAAVSLLGRVPGFGWDAVTPYLDSTEPLLVTAALSSLAWTDQPGRALPILLAHADTDLAGTAVYSAARAARFVTPRNLLTILEPIAIGDGKITSRKAALRLLVHLAVPGAAAVLTHAWRRDDQHRDVRLAAVASARQCLDDPDEWAIIADAVSAGPGEAVEVLLRADPFTIAPTQRGRFGELIMGACASEHRETRRIAWAALPAWSQWTPTAGPLAAQQLSDLDDRLGWRTIITAIVALTRATSSPSIAIDALDALIRIDATDPTAGDPHRDHPARQRATELVNRLVSEMSPQRTTADSDPWVIRAVARTVGEHLAAYPEYLAPATALFAHAVAFVDRTSADLHAELDALCDLVAERPAAAGTLARLLALRLDAERPTASEAIHAAATRLAGRADLAGGLVATALAGLGAQSGWPAEWRSLVTGLRSHPHPDVRAAALTLCFAPE